MFISKWKGGLVMDRIMTSLFVLIVPNNNMDGVSSYRHVKIFSVIIGT